MDRRGWLLAERIIRFPAAAVARTLRRAPRAALSRNAVVSEPGRFGKASLEEGANGRLADAPASAVHGAGGSSAADIVRGYGYRQGAASSDNPCPMTTRTMR